MSQAERGSSSQHAWLIECVTAHTPLWFDGSFERDGRNRIAKFVADANMAVRYPSRAAAEWAFESLLEMRPRSILGSDCYRITEHEWSGVRSESTSLSELVERAEATMRTLAEGDANLAIDFWRSRARFFAEQILRSTNVQR